MLVLDIYHVLEAKIKEVAHSFYLVVNLLGASLAKRLSKPLLVYHFIRLVSE